MTCFVILHYMITEETKKCIDSIKKLKGEKKIIVIDNASSNNSGQELKKIYKNDQDIAVILNKKNAGFANGNNIGYKEAKKYNPEYIVILNNDTEIVQEDFIERIRNIYIKEHYALLSPCIYSTKQKIYQSPKRTKSLTYNDVVKLKEEYRKKQKSKFIVPIKCFFKKFQVLKMLVKSKKSAIDYEKKYYNVPMHGSAVVFSKDFIEKMEKAFYSKTFMYYEMEILDYICHKEKLKEIYEPSIKVLHHHSVSSNKTFGNELKKVRFINKCIYDSLTEYEKLIKRRGEI